MDLIGKINESFELLKEKLSAWLDSIVLSIPNLILVIVCLIIGLWLIKLFKKLVNKLTTRSFDNITVRNLVNNIASVVMYLVLFLILLTILGLSGPVTTVLASAGVAGLALGLALQDPLMNLFSGIIMSVRHVFDIGDFVESNGFIGSVQNISLKTTKLRMLSGEEVNIPNKLVLQNPVKNFTTNGLRRVDLNCGVSYGEDLQLVKKLAIEAVRPLAVDTVERSVEFIYTGFGNSSIDFQIRFWTNPENVWVYLDAKSSAIMNIKSIFDKNDIMIPFPITTLDFGIKGGVSLAENMSKKTNLSPDT